MFIWMYVCVYVCMMYVCLLSVCVCAFVHVQPPCTCTFSPLLSRPSLPLFRACNHLRVSQCQRLWHLAPSYLPACLSFCGGRTNYIVTLAIHTPVTLISFLFTPRPLPCHPSQPYSLTSLPSPLPKTQTNYTTPFFLFVCLSVSLCLPPSRSLQTFPSPHTCPAPLLPPARLAFPPPQ